VTGIAPWDILKWVLLVLLAGFIGQFGKSLAQHILARVRKKREDEARTAREGLPATRGSDSPEATGGEGRPPAAEGAPGAAGPDKKAVKAEAKRQKKEAKLRSKLSG